MFPCQTKQPTTRPSVLLHELNEVGDTSATLYACRAPLSDALASTRLPIRAKIVAVLEGIEPSSPDGQSGIITTILQDRVEGRDKQAIQLT